MGASADVQALEAAAEEHGIDATGEWFEVLAQSGLPLRPWTPPCPSGGGKREKSTASQSSFSGHPRPIPRGGGIPDSLEQTSFLIRGISSTEMDSVDV